MEEGRASAIAVGARITTAWLASPVVCWLAAGFWNSILTYVMKAKDIKAAEAESKQMEARVKRPTLSKSRD
jgi:hypothetical protein